LKNILDLIRLTHWIKNFIIIIPFVFAKKAFILGDIKLLCYLFISLCIASSTVYIFNDLIDFNLDKQDNFKKNRPIASGKITKNQALILDFILLGLLSIFLFFLNNIILFYGIIIYLILNIFYSIYFKKVFLLDVLILSSFYTIKLTITILYFQLDFSYWLISIFFLGIVMVSFSKKYLDINNNLNNPNFKSHYNKKFLEKIIKTLSILIVILYTTFTFQSETVEKFSIYFLFTNLMIIYGIYRYIFCVISAKFSDPISIFTKDLNLIFNASIFSFFSILLIYLN